MKTLRSILVAGLSLASAVHAAPPARVAPLAPDTAKKTHDLFMGVDVSIEEGKAYHRVRDVSGSSWVINVNGRPEFIPTERKTLNLRVEPSLKLTESSATLSNLKTERAYTPGNDPRTQSLRTQIQMSAYLTEQAEMAERELRDAELSKALGGANDPRGAQYTPRTQPMTAEKMVGLQSQAMGSLTGMQFHQGIADEQLRAENYDAIAIDFDLAAEKPLPNPYMIIVVQFHERKAAPGTARNWIYAQSLNPIDATPKKIRLLRGGFPLGYEFEKVEVHLYDRGQEVATNLSPKRVSLTREEAFQYQVIEHIAGHKGVTLPPSPAMAALPADLSSRLAAGQGQKIYYVKVTKDGHVAEAYQDSDYTQRVEDSFFANAVKQIWFKPALEKGQPVEGQTAVDLTKLRL